MAQARYAPYRLKGCPRCKQGDMHLTSEGFMYSMKQQDGYQCIQCGHFVPIPKEPKKKDKAIDRIKRFVHIGGVR